MATNEGKTDKLLVIKTGRMSAEREKKNLQVTLTVRAVNEQAGS